MSAAILGLAAGFMLVLVILMLVLLTSQLHVSVKVLLIALATIYYWIQYESLHQYTGWPSEDDLPLKFVLIASDVVEPNQQTGEKGKLYWWVRDSADPQSPPRAYILPYRKPLHEESEQVLDQQKSGSQYVGKQMGASGGKGRLGIGFEKINKSSVHQKP